MTQDTTLEMRTGESEPILVRSAQSERGRARIAREVDRLRRASHPGVVALLGHDESTLTLAWAGGSTGETIAPTVSGAAAIVASLAATVADLHTLGILHGRIEPSHVVIDADGRPRLCGMRGRDPDEEAPLPTDDVAALGELLARLVGPGSEIEPIPERRWGRRRWSGFQRRALQTLADQATDPDPARRPTARALAASIAEVSPDAVLDVPASAAGVADTDDNAKAGMTGRSSGDTAPSPLVPGGSGSVVPPDPPAAPPIETPPTETFGPTDAREEADVIEAVEAADEADAVEDVDIEAAAAADGFERFAAFGDDPWDAFLSPGHLEIDDVDPMPVFEKPTVDEPAVDEPAVDEPTEAATFLGMRVEPGDLADDVVCPERTRPQFTAPALGPAGRSRVPLAAAAVVACLLAAIGFWALSNGSGSDRPSAARPLTSAPATSALPTSPASPMTSEGSSTPPSDASPSSTENAPRCEDGGATTAAAGADIDGDGCPEPVIVDGTTVDVDGARYEVGNAGDRVTVADWDCDGTATAGVVRPGTGEVFTFPDWSLTDGPVTVEATTVVTNAAELVAPTPSRPCAPMLKLADGSTVDVDLRTPAAS